MKNTIFYLFLMIMIGFVNHQAIAKPKKGTVPIQINVQPTSIQVSFGANSKQLDLLFYLVSNVPVAQPLKNFQFTSTNQQASNYVSVAQITNDCNNVLPPQGGAGICNVHVIINVSGAQTVGQSIGPFNFQFSFYNGSGTRGQKFSSAPFPIQFADGTALPSANRTFTFVNNCSFPIWLGVASGATNAITPDPANPANPTSCLTNSNCYPGSTCVFVHAATSTEPALSQCYWANPTPNDQPSNFKLDAASGPDTGPRTSTTMTFPAFNNGIDTIWSGGALARTGCTGSAGANSCKTGNCCVGATCGNTGACALGSGFLTPASKAEFTLLNQIPIVTSNTPNDNTDADSYDITLVDGFSVATSMAPTNGTWGGSSNPYFCGTPGSAVAQSPLGACSWTFTPTASSTSAPNIVTNIYPADYVWLDTTGFTAQTNCDSGASSCAVGTCGVAYVGGTTLTVGCGTQIGNWTADSLCGKDPTGATPVGAQFGCGQAVQGSLTLTDLYGCSSGQLGQSCYTTPVNTCCGCVNWNSISGVTVPGTPITTSCPASNINWTTYSQTTLEWLKKGCPTAYSYPYDDASSTFTCNTLNSNHQNVTNYTITFCPA